MWERNAGCGRTIEVINAGILLFFGGKSKHKSHTETYIILGGYLLLGRDERCEVLYLQA